MSVVPAPAGAGASATDGAPLTVAYYSPGWPVDAFTNGVVTYVAGVVEGMRRLGHRPLVLARRWVREADEAGDGVFEVSRETGNRGWGPSRVVDAIGLRVAPTATANAMMVRELRRAVSELGAQAGGLDLVEMEESFGWAAGLAGQIPVVLRLHGPWFINGENRGDQPGSPSFERRVKAEGRALRTASGVTAPSLSVLERTREYYGLPLADAEVIPNPVPPVDPERRWRPEEAEPNRVLFIGRFDRTKGGDTVIDAFARLLRDRPDTRLDIIGPDGEVEVEGRSWSLIDYIEHRIPGASTDGRVRWLGKRPHAELDDHRRRASAVVMASRNENFPMALAEAMALGCPVVSTQVGGVVELMEDRSQGLHCRPDDPEDMAAKLAELLADRPGAAAMGRRAADHCVQRLTPEAIAEQSLRFYRRVLGGIRGQPLKTIDRYARP